VFSIVSVINERLLSRCFIVFISKISFVVPSDAGSGHVLLIDRLFLDELLWLKYEFSVRCEATPASNESM